MTTLTLTLTLATLRMGLLMTHFPNVQNTDLKMVCKMEWVVAETFVHNFPINCLLLENLICTFISKVLIQSKLSKLSKLNSVCWTNYLKMYDKYPTRITVSTSWYKADLQGRADKGKWAEMREGQRSSRSLGKLTPTAWSGYLYVPTISCFYFIRINFTTQPICQSMLISGFQTIIKSCSIEPEMIQFQFKDLLFNRCLGGWVVKAVRILIHRWLVLWVQFPVEDNLIFSYFETPLNVNFVKSARNVRFVLFRKNSIKHWQK